MADAQNVARHLMESPANRLTPTIFCQQVMARLQPASTVVKRQICFYTFFLDFFFLSFLKSHLVCSLKEILHGIILQRD